jgi:hypothetical protein
MTTSDRWNVSLNSLVKFRKNWYYRIYVEDINGNESYIQFSVWNIDDDDKSDVNGFSTTNVCSAIGKVCNGSQAHYTNCNYHMQDGKRAITYREWYDCSTTTSKTTAYEQFILN